MGFHASDTGIFRGNVPSARGRGMHPPFLFFLKRETGRARSKEKPLGRLKSTLPRRFDRNTGVSAVGTVGIGNLYRVRFGLGEQGSYRPAFDGWVRLSGVVIGWLPLRFPRSPLRSALPRRAAENRKKRTGRSLFFSGLIQFINSKVSAIRPSRAPKPSAASAGYSQEMT